MGAYTDLIAHNAEYSLADALDAAESDFRQDFTQYWGLEASAPPEGIDLDEWRDLRQLYGLAKQVAGVAATLVPRPRRPTWSSGGSPRRPRTSSGWGTSPTSRPGPAFSSSRFVLDVYSRRIVGWAMATHLSTELVLQALHMAVEQRRLQNVIHHSDRGCQYTALAFGQRCEAMSVRPSRRAVGRAYDNAMAESFFATLECELIDRRSFRTQAEARMAIFRYLEAWYNPHRRHSSLRQQSPVNYENLMSDAA